MKEKLKMLRQVTRSFFFSLPLNKTDDTKKVSSCKNNDLSSKASAISLIYLIEY